MRKLILMLMAFAAIFAAINVSAQTSNKRKKVMYLKTSLIAGVDAGLTVNEIKEILVQSYAYCGFPLSLNALGTFMAVVNGTRKANCRAPCPREKVLTSERKTRQNFVALR